ncbi:DUF721 domain-containing protein [Rhizobiales bacterium Sp-1]|uniref:DUF721 domain-containing protein n=1 Tax=Segnochrobactrum spirostomi TaxID=2608987 RepID=A0A6A7Y8X1_9HYPH|nr:DUF721 domain-containing protein [Segnochrobactrum spirostomi]
MWHEGANEEPLPVSERPVRRRDARPLADLIGPAIEDACRKRGFATTEIVTAWADIVDPALAERARPECIRWPRRRPGADGLEPGTLIVRTDGPGALMITYQAAAIVERLNAFFGWKAVGRVKVEQRPPPPDTRPRPRVSRPLSAAEEARVAGLVRADGDPRLAEAVKRLGRQVLASEPGPDAPRRPDAL